MVDEGYAGTQILSQLHESIIEQNLSDKQKSAITEKMAVGDFDGVMGPLYEHWETSFQPTWSTYLMTSLENKWNKEYCLSTKKCMKW